MADQRTPRVNKALMAKFRGQTVRVVAKLITLNDGRAIVETSDGGEIEVSLPRNEDLDCQYLEIIGKVEDERTLKMLGHVKFSDNTDMKIWDQVVQIWHDAKFAHMF
ncbi:replication factor A protein 3 [Lentinus tigrinus ALCF2SS1-7]|uniref:Replication factor A protein 3 n=1 Tax=Lentinus tigrinus ALCF2SS1-6 TaxID=1328759 RepID=A0A5C2RY76_9APHY|nr:replication factor A protein 3 [Lentinus tigrinus ALCF2SS1-6]RPD75482.1 replication factor A protein 3 [Lentinus tigrinus ALCF2SS1-7]